MQANMRATGHSSEEISAALVQLFLNCPAVNPDETGQEQARRDQLRVLAALARRDQRHMPDTLHAKKDEPKLTTKVQMVVEPFSLPIDIPELGIELRVETGSSSHRMATSITGDRRDPEVEREGNDVTQAAFQSPTAHAMRTHGEKRLVYVASNTLPNCMTEVEPMSEV
jgi:hypothetical protein